MSRGQHKQWKGKRHAAGSNKHDIKRHKQEKEQQWRNNPRGEETKNKWLLENPRFEAFYQALGCIDENEFQDFLNSLRSPLPSCFHMNPSYPFTNALKIQLNKIIRDIAKESTQLEPANPDISSQSTQQDMDGEHTISNDSLKLTVDSSGTTDLVSAMVNNHASRTGSRIPIETLPWYPEQCGYKFGIDRRAIRKDDSLTVLHKWLILHTENGNITRQEAVSMIPPLALNVEPHHKCLDVCAAPGSKTSQLLEIVNRSLDRPEEQQGLVVANDSDTARAYMLVHQCRRINSPLLVVTTHKGQLYPQLRSIDKSKKGYFDRILCDVPCSGDGTMRKNPAIWSKWSTQSSLGLHSLQLTIATKSLSLLKPGGLMVYSTCSMSPYEDEAVVAELLRRFPGQLELIDGREFVPLFKSRRGLSHWPVLEDSAAARRDFQKGKGVMKPSNVATTEVMENQGGVDLTATDLTGSDVLAEKVNSTTDATNASIATTDALTMTDDNQVGSNESVDSGQLKQSSSVTESIYIQRCVDLGMKYYPTLESVPAAESYKVRRSIFPPTKEDAEWMHLERCMRCLPHDEDTGGFFVATFRLKEKTISSAAAAATADTSIDSNFDSNRESNIDSSAIEAELSANADLENEIDVNLVSVDNDIDIDNDVEAEAADVTADDHADVCVESNLDNDNANTQIDEIVIAEGDMKKDRRDNEGKSYIGFTPIDTQLFLQLKSFYGFLDSLKMESLFSREDFKGQQNNSQSKKSTAVINKNPQALQGGKSIFFMSQSVRDLLSSDVDNKLKLVSAGMKVIERKINNKSGVVEHRLVQEGIHLLVPHIEGRKVHLSIQDFCNVLGAGLVSFYTLSAEAVARIDAQPAGVLICMYKYSSQDIIQSDELLMNDDQIDHTFYALCWKGLKHIRSMNVICNKVEIDAMKHQMEALGIYRPKVSAVKRDGIGETTASSLSSSTSLSPITES